MEFFLSLVVMILMIIPIAKILQKAGFSGWWSLITAVPIVNIVMLYVFAHSDWPALTGNREEHGGMSQVGADYLNRPR
jgi:hypothetical protein